MISLCFLIIIYFLDIILSLFFSWFKGYENIEKI